MLQRVKEVQESDLRMVGALARNIQRVLAVTQAQIDAAAAQGQSWFVKPVVKVSDPLDNLRGGTQLVIKQNSILPGQNVMRVIYRGGQAVVVGPGVAPLSLPDAVAEDIMSLIAFGGTEQRNIPQPYTQANYVTNTAQTAVDTGIMIDFAKNYEFEVECRAVSGSWYILQSRASASGNVTGIHGETFGSTIKLVVGNVTVCTSAITRTVGNKLYVKATLNNGTATLYVKDETANTEDTQTGSYGTTQPNPTAAVYLLGNAGGQYVDVNSDIYMARIKENDTVVMDYVPASQVATAGFYDTVSGTFKTAETPANLSADGNTVPAPDAPMDIICNNGVLKFGKPVTIDSTRYYAYLAANLIEWTYSGDSYTIVVPVTVGGKYKITVPTTTPLNGLQNTIFRWGFTDTINTNWQNSNLTGQTSITSYDTVRTTPQDTPSVEVTATHPYMIIQMGAAVFNYIIANNLITITDQSIYTDGTVEKIRINANLFDYTQTRQTTWATTKALVDSVGTAYNTANCYTGATIDSAVIFGAIQNTICVPYKNGDTFCLTFFDTIPSTARQKYAVVDDDGIVKKTAEYTGGTLVTPNVDGKYILVQYANNATSTNNEGLVLIKGTTIPDSYVAYNGCTATCEDLLSIGTYTDQQEIIDGTVTRKVGVLVLDGTENWTRATNQDGSANYVFYTQIDDKKVGNNQPMLCSHHKYIGSGSYVTLTAGKFLSNSANTSVYFDGGSITTATNWKNWLATQYANGTPVIVIYPLATETTETVTGQPMQTATGDNTAEITQAGMAGLELEVEYIKDE